MSPSPKLQPTSRLPDPLLLYQANAFSVNLYEDWHDKTLYTLSGPVTDDIQHNIIISVDPDLQVSTLRDYADWNIESVLGELKACRLLKRDQIVLAGGLSAYRAIFSWWPSEDKRIYLEQVYVILESTGYKLTATFTKKTRKTLGPQVERMMLSFKPLGQHPVPAKNK